MGCLQLGKMAAECAKIRGKCVMNFLCVMGWGVLCYRVSIIRENGCKMSQNLGQIVFEYPASLGCLQLKKWPQNLPKAFLSTFWRPKSILLFASVLLWRNCSYDFLWTWIRFGISRISLIWPKLFLYRFLAVKLVSILSAICSYEALEAYKKLFKFYFGTNRFQFFLYFLSFFLFNLFF